MKIIIINRNSSTRTSFCCQCVIAVSVQLVGMPEAECAAKATSLRTAVYTRCFVLKRRWYGQYNSYMKSMSRERAELVDLGKMRHAASFNHISLLLISGILVVGLPTIYGQCATGTHGAACEFLTVLPFDIIQLKAFGCVILLTIRRHSLPPRFLQCDGRHTWLNLHHMSCRPVPVNSGTNAMRRLSHRRVRRPPHT